MKVKYSQVLATCGVLENSCLIRWYALTVEPNQNQVGSYAQTFTLTLWDEDVYRSSNCTMVNHTRYLTYLFAQV